MHVLLLKTIWWRSKCIRHALSNEQLRSWVWHRCRKGEQRLTLFSSGENKMHSNQTVAYHPKVIPLIACACFSFRKVLHDSFPLPAAWSFQWYREAVSDYVGLPSGAKNPTTSKRSFVFCIRSSQRNQLGQHKSMDSCETRELTLTPDLCLNTIYSTTMDNSMPVALVHHHHYGQYMKKVEFYTPKFDQRNC